MLANGSANDCPRRLVGVVPVAQADVQHAVGTEGELASIMGHAGLGKREHWRFAGGVGLIGIGRDPEGGDPVRVEVVVVMHEEAPAGRVVGREGETEQSLLAGDAGDFRREIEERRGEQHAVLDDPDRAGLEQHEQASVARWRDESGGELESADDLLQGRRVRARRRRRRRRSCRRDGDGKASGDPIGGGGDLGLPFGHTGHQAGRGHRSDVLIGGAPGKGGSGDGGAAGVLGRCGELERLADLHRRGGTGHCDSGDGVGRLNAAAITVTATADQHEQQHGDEGEQSGTATRECLGHKQLLFDAAQRVKTGPVGFLGCSGL